MDAEPRFGEPGVHGFSITIGPLKLVTDENKTRIAAACKGATLQGFGKSAIVNVSRFAASRSVAMDEATEELRAAGFEIK